MKCINLEKHDTCKFGSWNRAEEKLCMLYNLAFGCRYESKYIRYEDIPDDTIMYHGNIESTGDFRTKSEWIEEEGPEFWKEYDEWYTASVATSEINLPDLIEYVSERDENYEDWEQDVLYVCKKDPAIVAGIQRLNEIFAAHPTYWDDQEVVFEGEEKP